MERSTEKGRQGLELAYDEACRALVDLFEAYAVHAESILFRQDLKTFMANNISLKALVQQLVKAGLFYET